MDSVEERKRKVKLQKLLRLYPPGEHKFTHENDHNPVVLVPCARCHGRGTICEGLVQGGKQAQAIRECPDCGGDQYMAETRRMFANDSESMPVQSYADGWVRCPACRIRFALKDPNAWTGKRHIGCGQKLHVTGHDSTD
ncbi:hypothetical protein PLCT2_02198 [Planctomycetaceae bacterium]|nr:hypothetical protein PLCT2_02198 [Planctomycetaceae bacterium]